MVEFRERVLGLAQINGQMRVRIDQSRHHGVGTQIDDARIGEVRRWTGPTSAMIPSRTTMV